MYIHVVYVPIYCVQVHVYISKYKKSLLACFQLDILFKLSRPGKKACFTILRKSAFKLNQTYNRIMLGYLKFDI